MRARSTTSAVLRVGRPVAVALAAAACLSAAAVGSELQRSVPALEFQRLAAYGGSYTGVVVTGTQALATRGRVLEVFDVADPAAPRLLGTSPELPVAAQVEAAGPGVAYLVERNYSAPEVDNRYDQLYVVDVHDPGRPALAGSLRLPHSALHDVLVVGHLLYGAGSKEGIVRIDASDPYQPTLEQVLDLGVGASGLAAYDDRLLVTATDADYGGWLCVLEPLGALHLVETSRTPIGGITGKVAVTGHYAFAEAWQPTPDGMNEGATVLVDLADPAAPRIVGRLAITDVRDFAVTADRVFALEAPHTVRTPYHLWYMDPYYMQVAVEGDILAVTAGDAGLDLVRLVAGPAQPEPTVGPTLTPWPTRPPGTEPPPITPLPTRTLAPTTTPRSSATAVGALDRLYLPSVLSPLLHRSTACSSAGRVSAPEAEEYARQRARLEACHEPDMRLLARMTVREADELYHADLQGVAPGGVPLDPELCIWWGVFEGRAQHPTRPQPPPTAAPTSTAMPSGTTEPTEDPCPPAVFWVSFEKPGGWTQVDILWDADGEPTSAPEATATASSGALTPTPRPSPTPGAGLGHP